MTVEHPDPTEPQPEPTAIMSAEEMTAPTVVPAQPSGLGEPVVETPPPPPNTTDAPVVKTSHRTGIAITVAVVMTLIAVAALGLAAYEAGQASSAKKAAAASSPGTTTTSTPKVTSPPIVAPPADATTEPTDGSTVASAAPSDINPSGVFTTAYTEQQQLVLHVPDSCSRHFTVDLDEPRVNTSDDLADLDAKQDCTTTGQLVFEFGTSTGAIADNPDVTPNDCAQLIRTGALPDGGTTPITKGLVVCVATDQQAALTEGIQRKISVVQVTGIAAGGVISITVSAWNVPS